MYNTSKNKQVIYSLDTLSASLYQLMLKKNFNDITITEICENCNITRKTFYRNCDDIYDLIDYRADQEIRKALDEIAWYRSPAPEMVNSFFMFWEQRKKMLTLLYDQGLFPHFKARVIKIGSEYDDYQKITAVIGRGYPVIKEYYDAFVIGGFVHLLESWISHGYDLTAAELTEVYLLFKQGRQLFT